MKKNILLILLLVGPFLLMVLVNELLRPSIKEQPFVSDGISAINSSLVSTGKCTWYCSINTTYCKQHHVEFLKDYIDSTDEIYFGVIRFLNSTGNYHLANLIFLVAGFPLMIWLLIRSIILMQFKITKLKEQKDGDN